MTQAEKGTFIVIEGSDGSGKATQLQQLVTRLTAEGYDVATFDFPQYGQPSSYFVKQYLSGAYGPAEATGPYAASLFYALDRFEAGPKIQEALDQGKVVLANRYVGSNMGHQGTKFVHAEERRGYFIWLDNLEFEMLRIPRPNMSIVLRVPAETALQLIAERNGHDTSPRDNHEGDPQHLQKAVEVFDDMCQLFPKDFQRIDCTRDEQMLAVETINDIIWQKIEPLLPTKKPRVAEAAVTGGVGVQSTPDEGGQPRGQHPPEAHVSELREGANGLTGPQPQKELYVPDVLNGDLRSLYLDITNKILSLRSEIAALLVDHDDPARDIALRVLLPVAASSITPLGSSGDMDLKHVIHQLTKGLLPPHYANGESRVRLVSVWPRNELDIIPDIVYPASDLPLTDLQQACAQWPYEVKIKLLEAYLAAQASNSANHDGPVRALRKLHYTWDILCDLATILDLQLQSPDSVEHQALTPRYGYEVPKIIEEAGLTDQFEACFELSLQLHSSLQEAGHMHAAQYATLLGHKTRARLLLCGDEALLQLSSPATQQTANVRQLLHNLHQTLGEAHPTLADYVARQAATA